MSIWLKKPIVESINRAPQGALKGSIKYYVALGKGSIKYLLCCPGKGLHKVLCCPGARLRCQILACDMRYERTQFPKHNTAIRLKIPLIVFVVEQFKIFDPIVECVDSFDYWYFWTHRPSATFYPYPRIFISMRYIRFFRHRSYTRIPSASIGGQLGIFF